MDANSIFPDFIPGFCQSLNDSQRQATSCCFSIHELGITTFISQAAPQLKVLRGKDFLFTVF